MYYILYIIYYILYIIYYILYTLKVEIFACTYFRGYLFSRGFIFAIGIFDNFAVTYFREFREFNNFQLFREDLFSRISRIFYLSFNYNYVSQG